MSSVANANGPATGHSSAPDGKPRSGWIQHAKNVLIEPATFSILFVVLLFNVVTRLPWVERNVPYLEGAQLWFHQILGSLSGRRIEPKWVRVVEIDDATHRDWGEPTNRARLADLVNNAVAGDAAAIVLDFKLIPPAGLSAGEDDDSRKNENGALLAAVHAAALNGVPVILGDWLEQQSDGSFVRRPSIYLDSDLPLADAEGKCAPRVLTNPPQEAPAAFPQDQPAPNRLPACAWLGNINLPTDMRQIPLVTATGSDATPSYSLALQTVRAYQASLAIDPGILKDPRIEKSIAEHEFVYGSFIRGPQFQQIPVGKLASKDPSALELCRGRIVLIGGHWHTGMGNEDWVDEHKTPVGGMSGVEIHASYVEALLDQRYTRETSLWIALAFDLVAGAALYILFHRARGWLAQLLVLVVPAGLLVVSYVFFTNLNLYLDFILPLAACFVHLGVEYAHDYVHLRSGHTPDAAAGH